MRAILIDPFSKSVSEVRIPSATTENDDSEIRAIQSMIGCDLFDVAREKMGDEEIACYVDDNGLGADDQAFFIFNGRPMAGKAILLGHNNFGESASVRASVDAIRGAIQWSTKRYAHAALEMQNQAAMAQAISHGSHVEPFGPYGFISTPKDI